MYRSLFVYSFLSGVLMAPNALAQKGSMPSGAPGPTASSVESRAELLFVEGRKAAQAGDYPTACVRFEASLRLERAGGTLLNLADCEEHLGHAARAYELFREGRETLPPGDERRAYATRRLELLEPRTARIVLKGGVGHEVRIDGAAVPPSQRVLVVDPGEHEVTITDASRVSVHRAVSVHAGQIAELDATVPAAPPSSEAAPSSGTTSWGIGLLVGAGAAAAAAGVTFGLALDRKNTVLAHCDAEKTCDATGATAADEGSTFATAATISTVAAAALGAGGLYLVLRGSPSKPEAVVAPTATGLLMRGSF